MIFYTADLHFHYEPFLPSRPFDTVENMDRQLIHRWNEAVSEEDTVYVVGDVGYNRGLVPGDALSRLRGHKHLIRGNHDTGFENAGVDVNFYRPVTLPQLIENNRAFYSGAHDALIPPPPPPRRRGGDGWLPGRPDFRPLPSRPDSDKE